MPMGKSWKAVAVSVGVGLLPGAVWANELSPPPDTIVLLHPVNRLGVGLERRVGSHMALVATLTGDFTLADSSNKWSVGLEPGVHVYVSGFAPSGFWVGAHLEAALSQFNLKGVYSPGGEVLLNSSTYSLGGSARVGYTVILDPGLTLQVGVGVGALNARPLPSRENQEVIDLLAPSSWTVAPRMSLGLGWAF